MKNLVIFLVTIFPITHAKELLTKPQARFVAYTLMSDASEGVPSVEKFQKIFTKSYKINGIVFGIGGMVNYMKNWRENEWNKTHNPIYNDALSNATVETTIADNVVYRKAYVYRMLKDVSAFEFQHLFGDKDRKEFEELAKKTGSEVFLFNLDNKKYLEKRIKKVNMTDNTFSFTFQYKKDVFSVVRVGKHLLLDSQTSI